MGQVILLGSISGGALLIGSMIGLYCPLPKRVMAIIMAFGSGVLISALSIDLMSDAFEMSRDALLLSICFLAGAAVFVLGDMWVDKLGGNKRKIAHIPATYDTSEEEENTSGIAILLGTILDGIPESLVMGATLAMDTSNTGGLVFVAAVFLSNFPEGISGTLAMKQSQYSNKNILFTWGLMMLITIVFTIIGYTFLGNSPNEIKVGFMTFASGAILAMLCDSLLPEAFKVGGKWTGFAGACGFITAFLLSKLF